MWRKLEDPQDRGPKCTDVGEVRVVDPGGAS